MVSFIIIGTFFLFLILRVEISLSMIFASICGIIAGGYSLHAIAQIFPLALQSFPLMAVPFFVLAAGIMNEAGLTSRIFDFANDMVGHIKGGLGHVNVVASMIFAGMSGSNTADVAGLGKIEMKAMMEKGYSKTFSAAITVSSSCIGPIIPPSIIMLVYGVSAGVSVGRLFLGGFIPGVLMGILLMVQIYFYAATGRENCPLPERRASLKQKLISFKRALPALITPIIILGGMFSGLFTPTESGVIAVVYSLIIGFLYKSIKIKDLFPIFLEASISTAYIFFIVAAAAMLSYIVTLEQIPELLLRFLSTIQIGPLGLLLLINIILLFAGTIVNGVAALLIFLPILLPIAIESGFDLVHFGVVICVNLIIACVTPPVGIALFVICDVAKIPYDVMSKAILPWLVPLFICLLLIILFPEITLFLPNLLMGV